MGLASSGGLILQRTEGFLMLHACVTPTYDWRIKSTAAQNSSPSRLSKVGEIIHLRLSWCVRGADFPALKFNDPRPFKYPISTPGPGRQSRGRPALFTKMGIYGTRIAGLNPRRANLQLERTSTARKYQESHLLPRRRTMLSEISRRGSRHFQRPAGNDREMDRE